MAIPKKSDVLNECSNYYLIKFKRQKANSKGKFKIQKAKQNSKGKWQKANSKGKTKFN